MLLLVGGGTKREKRSSAESVGPCPVVTQLCIHVGNREWTRSYLRWGCVDPRGRGVSVLRGWHFSFMKSKLPLGSIGHKGSIPWIKFTWELMLGL